MTDAKQQSSASQSALMRGLSTAEARTRLKSEGYNELPRQASRTPLRIIFEVLREPMLFLLLGGGAIYLLIGELQDALILLAFALFSISITVVQESRTERVLEPLRDLTSPRALVIRDGERLRVAGREVVRGDLIVLVEGDRVPADAMLLQCQDLEADESLLTGESAPVLKRANDSTRPVSPPRPGGDDLAYVFSGSLIVRGSAVAEVVAVGARSEIGKIGQSLSLLQSEPPWLQRQTRGLIRAFAVIGGVISLLAVLLYGFLRGGWLDALLGGITLGMSMLPEEFPVVLTVFMAMGAWRISRARVLTRRAAAIETLGSATVLCTDKTGTLTENRMAILELRLKDGTAFRIDGSAPQAVAAEYYALVETGRLASAPEPVDPMERAFHALRVTRQDQEPTLSMKDWHLVRSYGLRPELLAMSNLWQREGDGAQSVIATKGAPEAIVELCRFDAAARAELVRLVDDMGAQGLRVLGVARGRFDGEDWPDSQRDHDFEFLGLVGLADPLRASVPQAVRECRSAGIKVMMITGDYPATAGAIARQAGLAEGDIVSGAQLEAMTDDELASRVRSASAFARVLPEQKLRIVNALKANGEIVAMTGDGVNDAPSLKAAHIGIAMGGRGTDVAREASSIVLLDDDFGSIVKSIRLGRRIYDNLRKAICFIVAVHVPIAGLALLPLLFGLPILFWPMHIAFLEMVIDPVCSLVFEAETEEEDVMTRPPRPVSEPLLPARLIGWGLLQGVAAFGLVAGIYLVALDRGLAENEVRALTFFSLVMAIVGLILLNRSFSASLLTALKRPNRALVLVFTAVVLMLSATLAWPFMRELFRFGPLHPDDLALSFGAGVLLLLLLESAKGFYLRR